MRNETIREISKTYVGGNPNLMDKLIRDRKDAKIGFAFLFLGFFFFRRMKRGVNVSDGYKSRRI